MEIFTQKISSFAELQWDGQGRGTGHANEATAEEMMAQQDAPLDSRAAEAAQIRTELRLKETALAAAQHDLLELQILVCK